MTDRQSRMPDRISPRQVLECEGVEDWRVSGDGACAYFRTGSFAAGARLVQAISQMAGVEDHKPDLGLRHDGGTVRLLTYTDDYYEPGRHLYRRGDSALARGGTVDVAIWVPSEQAEARVAAALAAAGRLVRDEFAPSWWTVADAAGNEVDIATTRGRE
jgi:pterin-4a-carbinolamine dehydratase